MLRFITHHWHTVGIWLVLYGVIGLSLTLFTNLQLDAMQNRGTETPTMTRLPQFGF